jgi:hypothetical protein
MKTAAQKCREAGILYQTYYYRAKKGWPDPFIELQHKPMTPELKELLKANGISRELYLTRKSKGWTAFEAANVLPNSHIYYVYNGKSIRSQISRGKYLYLKNLVNDKGMSVEEAFKHVTRETKKSD